MELTETLDAGFFRIFISSGTGTMGCTKPMETASIKLIQCINFVLGETMNKAIIIFFSGVITLYKLVQNSHETSCVEASCRDDWLFAS